MYLKLQISLTLLAASSAWSQTTVTLLPGANIQSAVNANTANTTFILTAGTYRLQSIAPKDGDSFIGQNNPVLTGAQILTNFTKNGNLWVAGGQTQQGQLNGTCDSQHPMCMYPEDLFFDNVPLLHVASIAQVVSGSWYFDYPNHNIYFFDNPTGHCVETTVTRSAFNGSAANVTITGLTVEKYAIPAQFGAIGDQYPGPNWTVTNNEVRWNHGTGINIPTGGQAKLNYVHHNGQKGIGGVGSSILVQGNRVSFNNWAGFDPSWEAGGMKFSTSTNLTVRGNTVDDNVGPGLWTDVGSINTLYENNVVANNTAGPGIVDEISYSAIIRNNTVYNNSVPQPSWLWGAQILIQNSQNDQVYGNIIQTPATGGNGIGIIQQNRGSGVYGLYLAINNTIHNNTVVLLHFSDSNGAVADYNQAAMLTGNNTFDYDSYHALSTYGDNFLWGASNFLMYPGFQQAGQELHGTFDHVMPPIF